MPQNPEPNARHRSLSLLGALLMLGAVLVSASQATAAGDGKPDWTGWYENAEGMGQAMEEQKKTGKPMFVYFYATWCGYCQQFDRVMMTEELVDDYMDDIIAVRINAENGRAEVQLKDMYGVQGYPSLFMHSSRTKTISRVTRMERTADGGARLLEAEDFVKELRNAAAR